MNAERDRERLERCVVKVGAFQTSGLKARGWAEANSVELRALQSWCAHAGHWWARLDGVDFAPSGAPSRGQGSCRQAHKPNFVRYSGFVEQFRALESGASAQACQLLGELEWVQPTVWRRLLVPTTIDLAPLHATLLFGLGWLGGHSHVCVVARDSDGPMDMAGLDNIADEAGSR